MTHVQRVCQHLDDTCAASPAGSSQLDEFETADRKLAEQAEIRLAPTTEPDKVFSLCQEGVVLRVWYNTQEWTCAIQQDKLARLVKQIRQIRRPGRSMK
jgi:hypothetical protein